MQVNSGIEDKKRQLAKRRREQILAAAKHVFAQNGFRRTKIEQIAENLSVGKGTLYRYFEDKKAIFLAVFERGIGELNKAIKANVEPIEQPPHKIRAAVKTYFEFFENDRELIEIMMQVRSEFKEDYRRIFIALYKDYIVRIQENLPKGVKMGFFRELDIEKTAEAISATLQGVMQSFYVREFELAAVAPGVGKKAETGGSFEGHRESLTDRTEAVTALLLEGLLFKLTEGQFENAKIKV